MKTKPKSLKNKEKKDNKSKRIKRYYNPKKSSPQTISARILWTYWAKKIRNPYSLQQIVKSIPWMWRLKKLQAIQSSQILFQKAKVRNSKYVGNITHCTIDHIHEYLTFVKNSKEISILDKSLSK